MTSPLPPSERGAEHFLKVATPSNAAAAAVGPSIGPERPPLKRGGADEEDEERNGKEIGPLGMPPLKKRAAAAFGESEAH